MPHQGMSMNSEEELIKIAEKVEVLKEEKAKERAAKAQLRHEIEYQKDLKKELDWFT